MILKAKLDSLVLDLQETNSICALEYITGSKYYRDLENKYNCLLKQTKPIVFNASGGRKVEKQTQTYALQPRDQTSLMWTFLDPKSQL